MSKRIGTEVSLAVAEAVRLCNPDVISAYPITPQTHIVEELSHYVANGRLDAAFVPVESEHTAMSTALGSSATGARTYTATSSQGLALMHEILFIAPAMRLPVVMTIANRSLSGPISIWNDHSDIMAERDIGWLQIFCENGQESFDLSVCAFKIAEDKRVLLPMGVNLDGFILSHMIEPIEVMDQAEVDAFLPGYEPQMFLDTANPVTMGPVGVPEVYLEAKVQYEQALLGSRAVVKEVLADWAEHTGREYKVVERNGKADAKTLFVTMGSLGESVMTAVDRLDDKGEDVGQVRIRLWRPFPEQEFMDAVAGADKLIVIDRALSPGGVCGPVATELKSLFYGRSDAPVIENIIAGIGGRDVAVSEFEDMYALSKSGGIKQNYLTWGVKSNA